METLIAMCGVLPPRSYYLTPREIAALGRAKEREGQRLWEHVRSAVWSEKKKYQDAMGLKERETKDSYRAMLERHGWAKYSQAKA